MLRQPLRHQLAELRPEDFFVVPGLDVAITKTKARKPDGSVLRAISWYDTKMLIQSLDNYFLPTSSQWGGKEKGARPYLQRYYPELEKDFITEREWVDSLIALPDKEGKYSSTLQISGVKKGKVPLLIEKSKVERHGYMYVVTEGKVTEVPELPLETGYVQEWDDDLGLPTKVGDEPNETFEKAYFYVNTNYDYHEGLRALVRWGRFRMTAVWPPSSSSPYVGFRLGRTVSDSDFMKISRLEYEALIKQKESISQSLKKLDELLSKVKFWH